MMNKRDVPSLGTAFAVSLALCALGLVCFGPRVVAADRRSGSTAGDVAGMPATVDELKVVTCLLPGQIRKLGRNSVYQTPRRPVRTTVQDCEIRGGEYVAFDRANYEESLRIWLEAANGGDAAAQYYVAELYAMGQGTEPDYARAAEWYRKSADNGNEAARFKLAHMLSKGIGVEQDLVAAFELTGVRLLTASEYDELSSALSERQERVGELEVRAADLRAEQAKLEQQLASASSQTAEREAELQARLTGLAVQLQARSREIDRQKLQIEELRSARETYDVAGPTIRIVDTATFRSARGEDGPEPTELVGVVEAPAGLDRLTVNEEPTSVDDDGFFHIRIDAETRFEIVAIDRRGERGLLLYELGTPAPQAAGEDLSIAKKVLGGNYHALIIGNADYESYPDLKTARADARAMADVLGSRYGFETTLLLDATWLEIRVALAKMARQLKPQDSLLLYYAGHGEYDEDAERGYWLGVDAGEDGTNRLSSEELNMFLEALPAKHVLIIADSCYAGWLTATGMARFEGESKKQQREWFREVGVERTARIGLTSGGLRPVLDSGGSGEHSIFAEELIKVLSSNMGVLAAGELFAAIQPRVIYRTSKLNRQQRPENKPIAGHGQGEFFFVPAGGA